MADTKKPELDPVRRKIEEDGHYGSQMFRWGQVGGRLSERRLSELLAEIELSDLWDDLTDIEREQAVKDVAKDRDWPGFFDRLAAEHAQADREAQERLDEVAAQIARAADESAKQTRKLAEQRARQDAEHQKQAEAAEAAASEGARGRPALGCCVLTSSRTSNRRSLSLAGQSRSRRCR